MPNLFQKINTQILPLNENLKKELKLNNNKINNNKININKKIPVNKNKLSKLHMNNEKIEAQIAYTAMMTDTLLPEEEE